MFTMIKQLKMHEYSVHFDFSLNCYVLVILSSPGGSPGRAIVLPPALVLASVSALPLPLVVVSALAKSLMFKFSM